MIFSFIVVLILFGGIFYVSNMNKAFQKQVSDLNNTNIVLKNVLIGNNMAGEVYLNEQKAESYYSEASLDYEKGDYKGVISNCKLARKDYSLASQGYLNIASRFKELNVTSKIIKLEEESYDLKSEIELNLYEACEHFESASRYYNTYFNTNVSSDDSSYEMAGKEMDGMNKKIDAHDENVRKYNKILSEITINLKKII